MRQPFVCAHPHRIRISHMGLRMTVRGRLIAARLQRLLVSVAIEKRYEIHASSPWTSQGRQTLRLFADRRWVASDSPKPSQCHGVFLAQGLQLSGACIEFSD